MSRQWSIGVALSAIFLLAPAASATEPPISFADSSTLALNHDDQGMTTRLLNETNTPRTVAVELDMTSGSDSDLVLKAPKTLAASGSAEVKITVVGDDTLLSGYLVATDQDGYVARQPFELKPDVAIPSLRTVKDRVTLEPWSSATADGELMALPLGAGTCKPPTSVDLVGGDDDAALTATCDNGSGGLRLRLKGMDRFSAGDYEGSVKVGDTDVSVKITRTAPVWLFLLLLCLGILVAVSARSFTAFSSLRQLKKEIAAFSTKALEHPTAWDPPTGSRPLYWTAPPAKWSAAPAVDAEKMLKKLDDSSGWGTTRKRFRWLLVPPTRTTTEIATQRKSLETVTATAKSWHDALADISSLHVTGPGSRRVRAERLRTGDAAAFTDPDSNDEREGMTGVQALLEEVEALKSDEKVSERLEKVSDALTAAPQPSGSQELDAELARAWAHCHLELTSLERAIDERPATLKRAELNSKWVERLEHEARQLEAQIPRPQRPPQMQLDMLMSNFSTPQVPVTYTARWRAFQAKARELSVRSGGALGDALITLLAVVLVIATGLATLYVGHAWGTGWDMLATFVAGAGGTLALTPLLSALDQISGVTTEKAEA